MNEYKRLGIYEKGDVIVGKNTDILLDCVWDIALIREIKGKPNGTLALVNIPVYDRKDVDCDIVNLFSVEAWEKIHDNALLQDAGYNGSILKSLIKQERDIPTELLAYIKDHFEGDTAELLYNAKTLSNAKWLYANGALLHVEREEKSVKEYWEMWQDKNHKNMYEYFFGENGICHES